MKKPNKNSVSVGSKVVEKDTLRMATVVDLAEGTHVCLEYSDGSTDWVSIDTVSQLLMEA